MEQETFYDKDDGYDRYDGYDRDSERAVASQH